MILRTDTPIHYFIKDESSADWHSLYLKCYLEVPQNSGKFDYRQLEHIWLFISAKIDSHEVGHFKIEFGRNDCIAAGERTYKDFAKYLTDDYSLGNFKVATQEQYLALRQKAFDIYLKHPHLDFNRLKVGDEI